MLTTEVSQATGQQWLAQHTPMLTTEASRLTGRQWLAQHTPMLAELLLSE